MVATAVGRDVKAKVSRLLYAAGVCLASSATDWHGRYPADADRQP
jgi:hypothetical protein